MSLKRRIRRGQRAATFPVGLLAALAACQPATAQSGAAGTTSGTSEVNLGTVPVITGATDSDGSTPESGGFEVPKQSFGPFGAIPTLDLPFSTNSLPQQLIRDTQARDVGELGRNDPSFGNYGLASSSGYPDFFIRGFPSDDPINHRIDGLPLTSQSGVVLDDFERVDLYKGLDGLLYGFGSPGGLINFVTKRPLATSLTELRGNYSSDSQFGGALDASRRFGADGQFGARFNLAGISGDTPIDRQRESNFTVALALDWRPVDGTQLWSNVSYQRNAYHGLQPGVFLGTFAVPRPPEAHTFLGLDFSGHTGTTRGLEGGIETQVTSWLSARGTIGNFRGTRNVRYDGATLLDDTGDYALAIDPHNLWVLSDTSGEFAATARFSAGVIKSASAIAVTFNREHTNEYTIQEYEDLPGTLSLYHPARPPDPQEPRVEEDRYLANQTYRNVAVTETLDVTDYVTLIGGVAFSHIALTSNDPQHYSQDKTTPSAGIVVKPTSRLSLYGSFIRGLEAGTQADDMVGAAPVTNARAYLPPFVSTQYEVGSKYQITDGLLATVALFGISRPSAIYLPTSPDQSAFTYIDNGRQVNKGAEFNLTGRVTPELKLFGGVTYLHAQVDRSQDGLLDGNRPIGIPKAQANLVAEYALLPVPHLTLIGAVRYKSATEADAANTRLVRGAATFDAGFKYYMRLSGHAVTARLYVQNIADHDYWSGNVYAPVVFLGDPRTFRFELSTRF